MKKVFVMAMGCWLLALGASAQTVAQRLQKAFGKFEADSQMRHAISSLYVIDANTGEVIFDKNSQVGLAPASTQKIITSVTAYEVLGKEYRYKTEFGYTGNVVNRVLEKGTMYVKGSGDPTFGSWRYKNTKPEAVFDNLFKSYSSSGIDSFADFVKDQYISIHIIDQNFEYPSIPDRWIWQDIGNYYGAPSAHLNWRENQYSISFKSGDTLNTKVKFTSAYRGEHVPYYIRFQNEVYSAEKGTGDRAYIYHPDGLSRSYIKGTIPISEDSFVISGSVSNPELVFAEEMMVRSILDGHRYRFRGFPGPKIEKENISFKPLYTHFSPPLDSIIYWFNKKSINLYGEALVKTFAYEKQGFGSTDSGVAILKRFWKEKGLDEEELNMYDGSGLSPMNRVTTHAQVEILKFARSRPWYSSFYHSLPEYNGMKIKSGTIGDVKGFCGYHKAKDGKEYIFSFLVNNYSGRTSPVVNKMYKVLDELK
jgi:D-alanyl-D-alanine carboxypeptidase/D-alanyl-D-alanine-endopeptidase (penicillin-binding protein 4)